MDHQHRRVTFSLLTMMLFLLVAGNQYIYAQTTERGTLLLSAEDYCTVFFDGEKIGIFVANDVKKIKTDFGEHILVAKFDDNKTMKKTITVKNTRQIIVKLSPPGKYSEADITDNDEESITKEKATELYKAELHKPSPVSIEKLKFYLSKGVDVLTTDENGWSLLHEAAFQGDTELVKFCLKNGLPVNAKSITTLNFSTPLSCATDQHHKEVVQLLLANNANFGITDGIAEMEYDSSNKYTGNFRDGKRNGHGTFYYKNGDVYVGDWVDDKRNGKGIATFSIGGKYEGDWVDDEMTGEGSYSCPDLKDKKKEYKYTGHFKKGIFSGQGILRHTNGKWYEGNFEFGRQNGEGVMHYTDGTYAGHWENGKRNGQGTFTDTNGNKYTGNWENDRKSGSGGANYMNGDSYFGNWSEGKPNGLGTYTSSSGGKYVGNFENGLKNGHGEYYYASGDRYDGNWVNGVFSGNGTYYYVNGDKYTGEYVDGQKEGFGVYTIGNVKASSIKNCDKCKVYKGNWKKDSKVGYGQCYDAHGKLIYEGEFFYNAPGVDYPNR